MDLSPLQNWLAADEALTAIVGDRVVAGALDLDHLPAIQISDLSSDGDPGGVIQLDAWTGGDGAKPLAEKLRAALLSRIAAIPPSVFSKAKIIRNNLVGCPRGPRQIDYRVSVDLLATEAN